MSTLAIALACGAAAGLGVTLVVAGLRSRPATPADSSSAGLAWVRSRWRSIAAAGAAALVVGFFTGWPVAALAAGAAAWFAPVLFAGDRTGRADIERIDAVAAWTESLRDTLSAAAGVEQAIVATAAHAPPRIRDEVTRLAADLRAGRPFEAALTDFAYAVGDETADLAVMALLSAQHRSGNLAELLGRLAATAREQAAVRMRAGAQRARVRTATRTISLVTIAMIAGLLLFNRDFMAPYGTLTGQLVLAMVVGLFALALWWLARLAAPTRAPSLLRPEAGR